MEKFDPELAKQMRLVSEIDGLRTFSQCGEKYDHGKFTPTKVLNRKAVSLRPGACMRHGVRS